MDARRFDALARAFTHARSRRQFVATVPLAVGGLAALRPRLTLADTGDGTAPGTGGVVTTADGTPAAGGSAEGTGGTTDAGGQVICLPIARTGESNLLPPFSAEIVEGACDVIAEETAFELLEVDAPEDDLVAVPPAALMARSVTTVRAPLDDLIDDRHSVVVRSIDDGTVVACGEIGGIRQGDELVAGLKERSSSGYSGTSLLRGTNGSTLVYVFLGRGLSTVQTSAASVGSEVVTTADVNLRADPAADAEIVTVIAAGTALSVTGGAVGEWVPVQNPATGDAGWVSAQFVEVQS